MRDWLCSPAWKSAVIVDVVPAGAKFVGYDQNGWVYYLDGRRLVTTHN